jgi:EpsI family protein
LQIDSGMNIRSLPVILIFAVTGAIIYRPVKTLEVQQARILDDYFEHVDGWNSVASPINESIVKELALDDFVSRIYQKGDDEVGLYIGYYKSSIRSSAAHSPLVCFPGQGWQVSDESETIFGDIVAEGDNKAPLTGRMMVVRNDERSVLVYFWYQAYRGSYSNSLQHKLAIQWGKIKNKREDSSLVRVTVPIENGETETAKRTLKEFLGVLYPKVCSYFLGAELGGLASVQPK